MSSFDDFLVQSFESDYTRTEPIEVVQARPLITQVAPISEDQLALNEDFQREAAVMYQKTMDAEDARMERVNSRNPQREKSKRNPTVSNPSNKRRLDNPTDIAKWAISEITWFRNNDMSMLASIPKLSKADPDLVVAMANVDNMYEATPNTATQFFRGAGQAIASPTSLIGFGVVGKAGSKLIGNSARQQLQRYATGIIKNRTAQQVAKMAMMSGGTGMAEGAAWSGVSDYTQQNLNAQASNVAPNVAPQDINTAQTAEMMRYGGIVGGGLGLTLGMGSFAAKPTIQYLQKMFAKRGQGTYGGNSFTDSDYAASAYASQHDNGTIRSVQINSAVPAYIDKGLISGDELADELDIDASFGSDLMETNKQLERPEVIEAIEDRGIDMVAYPEKVPEMPAASNDMIQLRDNETVSANASLDASGAATSYKTFSTPDMRDLQDGE